MENIALEVFDLEGNGSQFANLPPNTSITVTETSEIFDSGDIWSHSFVLNVFANASIFGTTGDIHGGRLHEQIDSRRARLWVLGLPMYYGYLKLDDEVDVEENGDVSVSFESGRKTFIDMVDGVKANQVPIPDDILIGMAVDRERTLGRYAARLHLKASVMGLFGTDTYSGDVDAQLEGEKGFAQEYPKFVRPDGTWTKDDGGEQETIEMTDTINTYNPYDASHPYCNVTVCYQKKEWKNNNGTLEKQTVRAYKTSEARRINPSPNFYVLYWLDILMKHLNIHIDENQMLGVEDLKRLFFVNTKCAYKTKGDDKYIGNYMPFGPVNPFVPIPEQDNPSWNLKATSDDPIAFSALFTAEMLDIGAADLFLKWRKAYATSDNFPNVDIKDVIEAIEAGFGVRLLFSSDYTRVRIVLLRNIFRSKQVQEMPGTTINNHKTENRIRGFRLTYGGSEDDTSYNYKGFVMAKQKADGGWLTEEDTHDYTQFDMTLGYDGIKMMVNMLNKTCYIDQATGNAYIVKIDKDYKDAADEAYPSLLECSQWMDAEDGDCTGDENTIKEIRVGFTPMDVNDTDTGYALFVSEDMSVPCAQKFGLDALPNYGEDSLDSDAMGCTRTKNEAEYQSGLFEVATRAPFVAKNSDGGDTFTISGEIGGVTPTQYWSFTLKVSGWIREGYRLYLEDNYEINDDLECPLEKHDWGLMLGIMRGSEDGVSGANVRYATDTDDGEGNDTWYVEGGGSGDIHSDSCSPYGGMWTYGLGQWVADEEWGDAILERIGWQNQCDLKNRRGPVPESLAVIAIINSYYDRTKGENTLKVLPSAPPEKTSQRFYIHYAEITDTAGNIHQVWLCCVYNGILKEHSAMLGEDGYLHYLQKGNNNTNPADADEILARDANGYDGMSNMVLAVDPPADGNGNFILDDAIRNSIDKYGDTLDWNMNILPSPYYEIEEVCTAYLRDSQEANHYLSPINYEDQTGRFSLKLRAEKPNPYYDPSQPEEIIRTKEEAGAAMQRIFTTSDTDLLDRPLVSNVTMRSAGWDAQGDGYATVYSIGCGVEYSDGKIHEILWTPIKENGTVLTKAQLDSYVNAFNKKTREYIIANDTDHLILDIDTTNERADLLHRLQAIYYASAGEIVASVSINPRYLDITTPALRHRGLADQFHAEESYWWRNARIIHKKRCMGIADIMNIDKTVQQKVDGVTGFVKKLQYSVDIQTGLSPVEMEIMYL